MGDQVPVDPHKYIVFNREYLLGLLSTGYGFREPDYSYLMSKAIDDAVVIRRQDVFAGPALHAYAANIRLAATLLKGTQQEGDLLAIASYFHEQATLADEVAHAGAAQLPTIDGQQSLSL